MEQVDEMPMIGLAKSERVAHVLEREIRTGSVAHGDQLHSEVMLMQRFDVSRNTVRRGLQILANRGLIATRTGIGSFVTYQGAAIDDTQGWSVALSQGPGRLVTQLLDLRRGGCARTDAFLVSQGQDAFGDYLCLDRLRRDEATEQGVSLEYSRLPWRDVLTPVLTDGLVDDSLHKTLLAKGLSFASGNEIAGVLAHLSDEDAAVMKRPAGDAMLHLRRLTKTQDGSLLEYVESILDPDRFGLKVAF
jgi:GntR family transcriptional regulator